MTRVFLDANVLFTAGHNSAGKAALLIELGRQGRWTVLTSAYAIEEARHNLQLKYPDAVPGMNRLLPTMRIVAPGPGQECPVRLPEKDRPIFLAALAGEATHLLTGDWKDFGAMMEKPDKTCGIIVQTVARFLASHPG